MMIWLIKYNQLNEFINTSDRTVGVIITDEQVLDWLFDNQGKYDFHLCQKNNILIHGYDKTVYYPKNGCYSSLFYAKECNYILVKIVPDSIEYVERLKKLINKHVLNLKI